MELRPLHALANIKITPTYHQPLADIYNSLNNSGVAHLVKFGFSGISMDDVARILSPKLIVTVEKRRKRR